ncbi:MAG: T9SS type A sorting domain-containing protein [Chitinophagaceae bacterium]|nr:T9SS type A sorting domain-containing protein [Chitinophagaceae bacterium]
MDAERNACTYWVLLVRIYNNEGQIVYQSEIRSQQMEIEAELARGVYFLKINSGQSSFTRKLIKL